MDRFRRGENVSRDLACAECGQAFTSNRRDAKFCQRGCSNRWHHRHRQLRQASQQPSLSPEMPSQ
jgi:hypothetical protein